MLIQLQPFGHQSVALDQGAQKPRLFGFQNLPQTAVAEGTVADERQPFNLGHAAFGHFEHQIDPAFAAANDLWSDGGRDPATGAIHLGNRGGIGLGGAGRIDPARLRGDDICQFFILEALVALEVDDVDNRVFLDPDHKAVALRRNLNFFEQARADDPLIGVVQLCHAQPLSALDSRKSKDRGGVDKVVSLDHDLIKAVFLRHGGCKQRRRNRCR